MLRRLLEERAKGGGVKNKRGRVGMFGLKVDERNWKCGDQEKTSLGEGVQTVLIK